MSLLQALKDLFSVSKPSTENTIHCTSSSTNDVMRNSTIPKGIEKELLELADLMVSDQLRKAWRAEGLEGQDTLVTREFNLYTSIFSNSGLTPLERAMVFFVLLDKVFRGIGDELNLAQANASSMDPERLMEIRELFCIERPGGVIWNDSLIEKISKTQELILEVNMAGLTYFDGSVAKISNIVDAVCSSNFCYSIRGIEKTLSAVGQFQATMSVSRVAATEENLGTLSKTILNGAN